MPKGFRGVRGQNSAAISVLGSKIGETMPAYLFNMFSFSIVAANCVPGRLSALVLANVRLSWNMIKNLQSCLNCDYRGISHYKIFPQNDSADICLDCRKQRIQIGALW